MMRLVAKVRNMCKEEKHAKQVVIVHNVHEIVREPADMLG